MLFSDFHPNEAISEQLKLRVEGETFLGPEILGHLFSETSVALCCKSYAFPLHRCISRGSFKRKHLLTALALLWQTTTDCPQLKQQLLGMATMCLIHGQALTSSRESGQSAQQVFETCVLGESSAPIQEIKVKKGIFLKLKGYSPSEDIIVMNVLLQSYSRCPYTSEMTEDTRRNRNIHNPLTPPLSLAQEFALQAKVIVPHKEPFSCDKIVCLYCCSSSKLRFSASHAVSGSH